MEAILRRERLVLMGGITIMVILAWAYLVDMARDMASMPMENMSMPGMVMADMAMIEPWSFRDVALLFVMWAVMMVAMMLPSAAPMILTFLSVNRRRQGTDRPVVPAYIFVLGYIAMWTAYSAAATLAQWGLHQAALISPGMTLTSPYLSGGILVAAGVFQWTRLKNMCLEGCRSPMSFLMSQWREGRWGAFVMGLRHGGYCVGCCWVLMALLFVTGVMNLPGVVAIAAFVLVEKLVPKGELIAKIAGVGFVMAGVGLIARSF